MTAIEVCRTAALGGLHCVVPGSGISPDGTQWISCRPRFFLSVRVLSRLFRRLFLTHLQEAFDSSKLRLLCTCGTARSAGFQPSSRSGAKHEMGCLRQSCELSCGLEFPVSRPVTPLERMAGMTRLELATSAVTEWQCAET
jgi:hypothetical protein